MGLVYVYLVAWVAGGVVLGANMLLQHEGERAASDLREPPRRRPALGQLGPLALIGFGLGGLAAEGFGMVAAPYTAGVALVGACLLGVAGYLVAHGVRH